MNVIVAIWLIVFVLLALGTFIEGTVCPMCETMGTLFIGWFLFGGGALILMAAISLIVD